MSKPFTHAKILRIQPIYTLLTMKWSLYLVYKQHWFQIYFHILASSWMIDTWPFDPEELFVCSMLALPRSYSGQLDLREFWLDRIEESLTHQQQNKNLIRMILNFFVNKLVSNICLGICQSNRLIDFKLYSKKVYCFHFEILNTYALRGQIFSKSQFFNLFGKKFEARHFNI